MEGPPSSLSFFLSRSSCFALFSLDFLPIMNVGSSVLQRLSLASVRGRTCGGAACCATSLSDILLSCEFEKATTRTRLPVLWGRRKDSLHIKALTLRTRSPARAPPAARARHFSVDNVRASFSNTSSERASDDGRRGSRAPSRRRCCFSFQTIGRRGVGPLLPRVRLPPRPASSLCAALVHCPCSGARYPAAAWRPTTTRTCSASGEKRARLSICGSFGDAT